jgi:glutamyl-tRNA synthetase
MKELIENFRIEDVSKSPAKFDYKKLDDINKAWMLKIDEKRYEEKVLEFLSEKMQKNFLGNPESAQKIIKKVIREKISKFGEIKKMEENKEFDYYFSEPNFKIEKIIFKDDSLENAKKYLKEISEKISEISEEN